MPLTPDKPRLLMVREHLRDLPLCSLPPGWQTRPFAPGDEAHWLSIQQAADQLNPITPALFPREFSAAAGVLAARQFYAFREGQPPAGTVTAWFLEDFQGETWGRVHWLAVLPQFQGQGLGKALLGLACARLRELGYEKVILSTSPLRTAAVHLYRQFGFKDFQPCD